MTARLLWILAFAFLFGCGGVSVLPEPFTRERADGKIPVKTELIRNQVRAELDGMPEGEAEVARWQTIETDYNQCRLSSAESSKAKAEEVFSVCMSERGYVYMFPIDAEQFHNDVAEELTRERDARLAAERKAEEERIAAERKAAEEAERKAEEELIVAIRKAVQDEKDSNLRGWAADGNIEEVRAWLANQGANPNAANDNGGTALMGAAFHGHAEVAKLLLSAGANPNAANDDGAVALGLAAIGGHAEIAKILLSAGAFPNMARDDGLTALMLAAENGHTEVAEILLSAGARPNATRNDGLTALMEAAFGGHAEIVNVLLSAGANPNAASNDGRAALMIAVGKGNAEVVKILLASGAEVNQRTRDGYTALDIAEEFGFFKIVRILEAAKLGILPDVQIPKAPNAADSVFANVWRSVVVINAGDNQGSGVIVRPNVVATNCHVVDGGGNLIVSELSATIRKRDDKRDFCLLNVPRLRGDIAKVRRWNTLTVGENVYGLGAPQGLDLSLSSGIISQLRQGGGERFIQIDAAISPGSSGGGLFDSDGNLIGIMTFKIADENVEGIGFAIPADLILGQ